MKIGSADPDGRANSNDKADCRADHTQGCSLGGEEALQHTTGGAQGFHEGKVAAAVGDPSGQGGEYAHRGGENDQDGGNQKRGPHFSQHIGLCLGDLSHGVDIGCRESLGEALNSAADFVGRT